MAQLDRVKEQLAYLKLWQGIMVVTDISLVGWIVTSADTAGARPFALAIVAVVALTSGIIAVHRRIERRIDELESL